MSKIIAITTSVMLITLICALPYATIDYPLITVIDKERICDDDLDCDYLIYTDQGIFENTDSILHGKFDSRTLYTQLRVGDRYTVKVSGFQIPVFDMHKNLLEIKLAGVH